MALRPVGRGATSSSTGTHRWARSCRPRDLPPAGMRARRRSRGGFRIESRALPAYLPHMVERRFPRAVGSLDAIFAFLGDFVAAQGLDLELKNDLDLIAEELFTNLVKYGPAAGQEIRIALDRVPGRLEFVVQDFDVEPFDLTQAKPVDVGAPLGERRPGGLGIHLVKRIADDVRYEYEDRTSTITVIKRLAS